MFNRGAPFVGIVNRRHSVPLPVACSKPKLPRSDLVWVLAPGI